MAKQEKNGRTSVASELAALFHNRWAVPVIAELERRRGAKFITLVNTLGVSRDALSRTLKALAGAGWVVKNPGHGHPMRPEYILTEAGQRIGDPCRRLFDAFEAAGHSNVMLLKWSAPVLCVLEVGPARFGEVAAALPASTPRALTLTLKALVEASLAERDLMNSFPPRSTYTLTPDGRALAVLVVSLANAVL